MPMNKKHYGKWFLTRVKKASLDFDMIRENDRIAVGISGGKDSSALLFIFHLLKYHLPFDFQVVPIYVDLGFGMDLEPLETFCRDLGFELITVPTDIREVVFEARQEKNPCSLCAKMRKGALITRAKEMNCNKVAMGHHLDDAIETFFLNLFYAGKLGSFSPSIYLDRMDITLIRPMIYLSEDTLISLVRSHGFPVVKNRCPMDGLTKRQDIKEWMRGLTDTYPDFREKFRNALRNPDLHGIWVPGLTLGQPPERKEGEHGTGSDDPQRTCI